MLTPESAFEVSRTNKVLTIKCPSDITAKVASEFDAQSKTWASQPQLLFLLDFSSVETLDPAFFRPLVLFYQTLKSKHRFIFTLFAKPHVLRIIHQAGLDSVFSPKNTIREAMESAGLKTSQPKIDVEFINPFIEATKKTLETQANTPVTIGKPHLKNPAESLAFDIAGVISLTSNRFQGSIALCFPARVFLAIYSNMLGEKHDTITKEIEDAAGELLNIIFGQAKATLNDRKGFEIQKAIPAIVRGSAIEVHHISRTIAIVLPFETQAGPFQIEVSADAT